MSLALRRARDRVRFRLRDNDPKLPTFSPIEYDVALCEAYLALQGYLPPPSIYTASAFTISAAGDTFRLPITAPTGWTGGDGGAEYAGDVRIRLVSTGEFLRKATVEEIDAMRSGHPSVHLGIPSFFCLWEESDQEVQGRVYPGAKDSQACDLFATMQADDLRDYVGAGTDDMDDVELQLSRQATHALLLYTSADLLERMIPEDAAKRRLNPKVAPSWRMEAERQLYREAGRRHDLEDVGRTQRWVG